MTTKQMIDNSELVKSYEQKSKHELIEEILEVKSVSRMFQGMLDDRSIQDNNMARVRKFATTFGMLNRGDTSRIIKEIRELFYEKHGKDARVSDFNVMERSQNTMQMKSDEMKPTINEGEIIYISRQHPHYESIIDGRVYAIISPDGLIVRRINIHPLNGEWTLMADNKKYKDMIVSSDEMAQFIIVGRATETLRVIEN